MEGKDGKLCSVQAQHAKLKDDIEGQEVQPSYRVERSSLFDGYGECRSGCRVLGHVETGFKSMRYRAEMLDESDVDI